MLDSKYLREHSDTVAKSLKKRGFKFDKAKFKQLDQQRKYLQIQTQDLQHQRNQLSKSIGLAKAKGEAIQTVITEVNRLRVELENKKIQLVTVQEKFQDFLLNIPNIPHETIPPGQTESENVEIRRWGEQPNFNFTPKTHEQLAEDLKLMDFAAAAKIAGSRYVVMRGDLVRMHRALIQFMMDVHTTQHGYEEIYVPYIVNRKSLQGTGQLPKFAGDQFKIEEDHDFYLIPTGEVPVTNTVSDEIIEANKLPLKYVCHTPCFRREAGTYGKDTRGMFRQHQFEKVELVWIVTAEESYPALEKLTNHAQAILQKLNLPFRVVTLCGGDLGFSAAKTYDLEVWLPSQQCYREIASCSNCEDFQARRMNARWRDPVSGKPQLLHTLNGSGLAVGRTLIAILENYQDNQGRIHIPPALQPYMGGMRIIG